MGDVRPLAKKEDIIIGNHGLIVEKGVRKGLLLPQVATEYSWNQETFLEQTCFKAGIESKSYLEDETKVFFFESFCFSEKN
jgi:uncharacterized protein (TIGR00296 family)